MSIKLELLIKLDRLNMVYKFVDTIVKDGWQCNKWSVTLKRGHRSMTLDYFTGLALGDLDILDVVDSIRLDSNVVNYSFEEWCEEYQYDINSRSAHQTYKQCIKQAGKFSQLFSDGEIFDLYMEAEN